MGTDKAQLSEKQRENRKKERKLAKTNNIDNVKGERNGNRQRHRQS